MAVCKTTATHKWCPKCQKDLLHKHFSKDRSAKFGLTAHCKPCGAAYQRQLRSKQDPKLAKERTRKIKLKAKYGISVEQYDEMFESQNGVCVVCQKDTRPNPLAVDHDHTTGEVRGLLCKKCNSGLGFFNDDIEVLERAKQYLSRNKDE